MIVLIARYYVVPGMRADVEALLLKMARLVARNEPACRTYHVSRSVDDDQILVLYEMYDDMAAVEAHRATRHYKELVEGAIAPLLERRERNLYEAVIY